MKRNLTLALCLLALGLANCSSKQVTTGETPQANAPAEEEAAPQTAPSAAEAAPAPAEAPQAPAEGVAQ